MATQTAVKEKPILFSGPMVRAILDGRKTVTRRVVKQQPTLGNHPQLGTPLTKLIYCPYLGGFQQATDGGNCTCGLHNMPTWCCPYGMPGDRLWVKEAFYRSTEHANCYYTADGKGMGEGAWLRLKDRGPAAFRSIFMPRWASRLTLEVVSVRVERLQEITDEDVIDEGFPRDESPPHDGTRLNANGRRMCFAELWDRLNEKRGFSWESNPFVWRVEFKRL